MQNNRGERLYVRLCFRSEAEAYVLWDSSLWSELEEQIGSRCRKRDGASWVVGYLPLHGIDQESVFRTLLARLPISRVTSITEAQFDASRSNATGWRDPKFYFGSWLTPEDLREQTILLSLNDTYFITTSNGRMGRALAWVVHRVMGLKLRLRRFSWGRHG
ncbi:MAG: hypothetical protein JNJ88_12675 [Planctomycetes bacterium]|nr:hypothetical protein [Planctomycetota bacterium]